MFYLFCFKTKSKRFSGLSKNTQTFGLNRNPVLIIVGVSVAQVNKKIRLEWSSYLIGFLFLVMQGIKIYQEKLFNSFRLSDHVSVTNFYRRLKDILQLDFLYKETAVYYCKSGQKSIAPIVFFKLSLIGYLENIISDRKLIFHCSMRLDLLYFLDYRTQTKKKEYGGFSHLCKDCPIRTYV